MKVVNDIQECPTLHFPADCPKCAKTTSVPTRATTLPGGGVHLELRCRECQHEWECTLPPSADDIATRTAPKPDRRASHG